MSALKSERPARTWRRVGVAAGIVIAVFLLICKSLQARPGSQAHNTSAFYLLCLNTAHAAICLVSWTLTARAHFSAMCPHPWLLTDWASGVPSNSTKAPGVRAQPCFSCVLQSYRRTLLCSIRTRCASDWASSSRFSAGCQGIWNQYCSAPGS